MGDVKPQDGRPHKRLDVWRKSIEMTRVIYEVTGKFPAEEKYGLSAQMRRSAVSIASNVAEGAARQTGKEFIQFLHIARGSVSELDTQLEVMVVIGFGNRGIVDPLLDDISRMLSGLIRHVEMRNGRGGGGGT